jgi:hypothetical protein
MVHTALRERISRYLYSVCGYISIKGRRGAFAWSGLHQLDNGLLCTHEMAITLVNCLLESAL